MIYRCLLLVLIAGLLQPAWLVAQDATDEEPDETPAAEAGNSSVAIKPPAGIYLAAKDGHLAREGYMAVGVILVFQVITEHHREQNQ